MKLTPIQQRIYDSAYSCLRNAAHGNTDIALKDYKNIYELGKDNLTITKLICHQAEKDWMGFEISKEGLVPGFYPIKRVFNYMKFDFSKTCREISQKVREIFKTTYPKTYKIRNRLIHENKVRID